MTEFADPLWPHDGPPPVPIPRPGVPFTEEELEYFKRSDEAHKTQSPSTRDPRICVCGHPARAHTDFSLSETQRGLREMGRYICQPSRQICPCKAFHEVLRVEDTRTFRFQTKGPLNAHALFQGAKRSAENGHEIEWSEGVVCGICARPRDTEMPVYPVALKAPPNGGISQRATPFNRLLCWACYTRVLAGELTGHERF